MIDAPPRLAAHDQLARDLTALIRSHQRRLCRYRAMRGAMEADHHRDAICVNVAAELADIGRYRHWLRLVHIAEEGYQRDMGIARRTYAALTGRTA